MAIEPGKPDDEDAVPTGFGSRMAIRTAIGGVFMGIANLIPGVSGGTMILAVGLYEEFIDSVADITAFRFSARRILFLGTLLLFAGCSIVILSSVILFLLLWHSALMFALFIGLTLGGAPLLARMIGRFHTGSVVAALAGFVLMAGVAMVHRGGAFPRNTVMDFVSGVVGATTMVLPGISGSYMLLILDQYDRVVGAVSDLKHGSFDALKILVPVNIGAILGVVGLSNLLKLLLHRYERVTLGFLLGILLGSVLGLWPFGRAPTLKLLESRPDSELRTFAEQSGIADAGALEGEALATYILERWPDRTAPDYTASRIVGAIVMVVVGLAVTTLLCWFGGKDGKETPDKPALVDT